VTAEPGQGRVQIADHGGGIPESSQARIFQKFFQADSSSARERGGTGLGLSICKALIERMEGRIGFRSEPGETVFEFALPAERAGAPAGPASGELPVLVVEDDFAMSELLRRLLEDMAPVTVARTLSQAREQITRHRCAIAILDLGLPDGSGADLLPLLRQLQPHAPVLIFSELPLPPGEAGRVAAVLSKSSTSLEDLVGTVRRLLEQTERTHGDAATATHLAG
jgi:CheY-like chemotaxis protein